MPATARSRRRSRGLNGGVAIWDLPRKVPSQIRSRDERIEVFVTRSCSEPLELLGERQLLIAGIFRLVFAHHMDQLDATQDHAGAVSGLETEHWTHPAFVGTVILLDAVVEILTLPDPDRFQLAL